MKSIPKLVCVVGTFPDRLNTNRNIRSFIAAGCQEYFSEAKIVEVSHELFYEAVDQLKPDLFLFVGSILASEWQVESMLDVAGRNGAIVAIWVHDDPYEFDAYGRLEGLVDAIFSNDKAATYHYPASLPVFHLPMASPRRKPIHLERTGADFFFAGYPYETRMQFFEAVWGAVEGTDVSMSGRVYGPGWNVQQVPFAVPKRLNQGDLVENYQQSLATIYLGRDLSLSNDRFGIRPSTPGPRLFEAAGAGACQIAMTPGLEILEYFVDQRELYLAESYLEALDIIWMLRKDPRKSVAVGLNARSAVVAKHLYCHRIAKMHALLQTL